MDGNEVLRRLDEVGRCNTCDQADNNSYCYTYVGPRYGNGTRILFIGLDHGQGYTDSPASRQEEIVEDYRKDQSGWNPHYKGCVWVAAEILGMGCRKKCAKRCQQRNENECALLHFAQANAVKCGDGNPGMTFRRHERISECIPLVFHEIEILQPHVIVLQGRNDRSGHIQVDFRNEAQRRATWMDTPLECVSTITWERSGTPAIVLSFRHPARGWLQRDWEPIIAPALKATHEILKQENKR